jgi:hypothetical protein
MSDYVAEFKFHILGCESDEAFEEHLDRVLDSLHEDERVVDPDYTASLRHRRVSFTLTVAGEDQGIAFTLAHAALRAAIHGAEGATPGWESQFNEIQSSVRSAELQQA